MKKIKIGLRCCLLLLICVMIGGGIITVVNYLPVNQHNKSITMAALTEEVDFMEIPSLQNTYGSFQSMEPTALELATDELMLRMAMYEGEGEGITQAFLCYSDNPGYECEYSRYWHGYVAILRPLLLFLDYYEIRILNALCQSMIVAFIAFLIYQQKGMKYALAFASSYILLMPMALGFCLQYSWAFYASFLPLLVYIKYRKVWREGPRYLYYFLVVGVVTNYLDLLTYPLLSWGLLITWWLILDDEVQRPFYYLKKVVLSGIAWIVGYGGMWMGKWTLGSIVLKRNLFEKAISEALLWTVNEGETAITLGDRIEALYINWRPAMKSQA